MAPPAESPTPHVSEWSPRGEFRLIVGLGNPGAEYRDTRHNIGWLVLEQLVARHGATFKKERKWKAEVAELPGATLLKPLTWMNLSGESVAPLARFFKIPPEAILVVYDDMALPLGKLRLRQRGSAGGHNGLKSIITHVGTEELHRLRLGIGAPGNDPSWVGHVLGTFREEERPLVESCVRAAADAVEHMQTKGFTSAMNYYNQQTLS